MTRRQKIFAAVAGFTVAVANVIVLAWPRRSVPDLMTGATKLMPLNGAECFFPYWSRAGACLCLDQTSAGYPKISQIDMTHEIVSPLPAVNRAVLRLLPKKVRPDMLLNGDLSPDNQWVWISAGLDGPTAASPSYAIQVPDAMHYNVDVREPFDTDVWLTPGHCWLEETDDGICTLHFVGAPHKATRLPSDVKATPAMPGKTFNPSSVLCIKADGSFVTGKWDAYGESQEVFFWNERLTATKLTVSPMGVATVPKNMNIDSLAVSPNGRRVAYYLSHRNFSLVYPYPVTKLLQVVGYEGPQETQVWLSAINGAGMKELYHLDPRSAPNGIGQLRWTPDGKRLTFVKQDALYSVPVPETSVR